MKGTIEEKLAKLRAQRDEKETLTQRDNELAKEQSELENEFLVQ